MSENNNEGKTKISIQKIITIGGIITALIGFLGLIVPMILTRCSEVTSIQLTQTAEAQAIAHTQTKEAQLSAVPPTETSTRTAAITPSETPPIVVLSPSVQFLAFDYFDGLNNEVTTKEDLEKFWNLLTENAQHTLNDDDSDDYKDWWWDWRVKYKLYECSDTEIVVDLDYYARDDYDFGTSKWKDTDLKYELTEIQGGWLIYSVINISAEGHYCDLAYEN